MFFLNAPLKKKIVAGSAAIAICVTALSLFHSAATAHDNGLATYEHDENMRINRSTCRTARAIVKQMLRDRARAHCRNTHDSPKNALRNKSFNPGICRKTKERGQRTYIYLENVNFQAQCR